MVPGRSAVQDRVTADAGHMVPLRRGRGDHAHTQARCVRLQEPGARRAPMPTARRLDQPSGSPHVLCVLWRREHRRDREVRPRDGRQRFRHENSPRGPLPDPLRGPKPQVRRAGRPLRAGCAGPAGKNGQTRTGQPEDVYALPDLYLPRRRNHISTAKSKVRSMPCSAKAR